MVTTLPLAATQFPVQHFWGQMYPRKREMLADSAPSWEGPRCIQQVPSPVDTRHCSPCCPHRSSSLCSHPPLPLFPCTS